MLGQDQQSKSTLERVAQSSSPTHLSAVLRLSHLADASLCPVQGELKSSRDEEQKSAKEAKGKWV